MKLSAYLLLASHLAFAIAVSATEPDQITDIAAEPLCCPLIENDSTGSKPSEDNKRPNATDNESAEQFLYRNNLEHALIATQHLIASWPLKFVEKAIANKEHFNSNVSGILTIHLHTLLSLGAPKYKVELPELYQAMDKAMALMDKAVAAALYQPPADLLSHLNVWRAINEIKQTTEAAPWKVGPTKVTLDPDVEPVTIPKSYRLLLSGDRQVLDQKLDKIRSAALQKLKPDDANKQPSVPKLELNQHWFMPIDGRWSGSIFIKKNRTIPLAVALPDNNRATLEQIKSRRDPISNLDWTKTGTYSREVVRWLIEPEKNTQDATVRWAMTDGAVAEPLGINFIQMTLGANQQIFLGIDNLKAAEAFLKSDKTYDSSFKNGKQQFTAEYQLNQALLGMKPLLESLQFKPDKRVERAQADTGNTFNSIESLIIGEPSIMERGVKRIIAEQERKSNFWLFLQDNPRYLGRFLGALILLIYAVKKGYESYIQDDNVWTDIAKLSLKMLGIAAVIIGVFFLVLHLTVLR